MGLDDQQFNDNIEVNKVRDKKPIEVPPGNFEAPRDQIIYNTRLSVGSSTFEIPTIEQTESGNCTEYSYLNAALMARSFGLPIGEELKIFLDRRSLKYVVDNFEHEYVIPILEYAHQFSLGIKISPNDIENLNIKRRDIYESLTATNGTLLFWLMLNGLEKALPNNNFIQSYAPELVKRLRENRNYAIMEGGMTLAHATTIVKIEGAYFSIDPFRRGEVIRYKREEETLNRIRAFLNGRNFLIISDFSESNG